ncbi:unnamed protein product [Danaus chrysippus]|uniref:(African queen) hypothetical protein n=1 Tax=Danaus chrysippus TaxID=151541 RepID=A0A8J2VYI1_9NEOP|nr:unnamed protein product [Danaus chrysippus]
MPSKKKIKSPQQLWENISSIFVTFVERIFFSLGVFVARNPWKVIAATWIFVLLSCCGLYTFYLEKNPMKLWVPPESDFYYDTNWYIDNFGTSLRMQKLLVTADNVLDPHVINLLSNITNEVSSIQIHYNNRTYSKNDLCFKVPVVAFASPHWKARSEVTDKSNNSQSKLKHEGYEIDYYDPSLLVDNDFYCSFIESFSHSCYQDSIVDIWKNDEMLIKNLTKFDIIKNVNEVKINPITGHSVDYTKQLGGIQRDESGLIVSAKSVLITWYMYVNMTEVDLNEVGNLVGTEDWVTVPLAMWEKKYLRYVSNLSSPNNIQFFYETGGSFADISGETMFSDMDKLSIGIMLMFFYVVMAVSRFNWLEIRLTLGSVGLLSVGMAYITTVGWCSLIGIPFGPVHSSLPFLLMGLGVDDMFVMNACWKIVLQTESHRSIPVKVGHMLKHAGVSIVITSFTDIVALMIGAITILPSLKSFCIYAAVGVFFIFCYSVTFFVAVFTIDIKRIRDKRNGIIFCYKHNNDVNVSSKTTFFQKILETFYKNVVFTIPGKATVILFVLIATGVNIVSVLKLEQRFDPKWFIPDDTYYKQFLNTHEHYYPDEGYPAMVFLGDMDYYKEFNNLYDMIQVLRNESYVTDVVTWVETFHGYVLKNFNQDLLNSSSVTEGQFKNYLSRFIYSGVGGRFQINFKLSGPHGCGKAIDNITATTLSFRFTSFKGPQEYIPAMNHVKDIVKSTSIVTGDGYRSVWSKAFANWATDEVIAVEVERNIELALLCVMLCTVILITNLQMCLWIFICVLLTIVNVLGGMQRWGMTVDIVCCIGLELAIGLCVDYAAHVGHTFLTITQGDRGARAYKTVTSIGSAVLLGGGSTFLSLSLLSMSKAYTFQSFFKIFFLVILFGLFNGLLFLPVILSLIGPAPYKSHDENVLEAVELNGKTPENKRILAKTVES